MHPWKSPPRRNHFLHYEPHQLPQPGRPRGKDRGQRPISVCRRCRDQPAPDGTIFEETAQAMCKGNTGPGSGARKGALGLAPDWHTRPAAYHFGITYIDSSWLDLNILIFSHHPKWRRRRRNSDKSNNIHTRGHLSYPCKLSKDASNTSCMGTTQSLISKQSITAVCSPAIYTSESCPPPWHHPPPYHLIPHLPSTHTLG